MCIIFLSFFSASGLPSGFPRILKSPKDSQYKGAQYYGSNLTFQCDAAGKDTEVRWFFRRVPINRISKTLSTGDQKKLEYKITRNGRELTIFNLGKITMSSLECFVANSVGMNTAGSLLLSSKPKESKFLSIGSLHFCKPLFFYPFEKYFF